MKNPIKYPSYIDSEVEWLHEIPSHWKIVKAKRIFHETSIKNHSDEPLLAATQTKGVIPKSLYENTTVTATMNFETLKFVKKGDFVISLRSFQGGIEYAHYQGIISPAYTILEPQEDVVHNYYRYLLKSKHYISGLTLLVTGIREGQNIDTGKFKDSFLPLPSKDEQIVIAAFLDFKLAKIDRFIRKKKQLIKLLNEQKAAIINQAVTKGLDPNAKMKPSVIEWLGDIPEHWEMKKLKFSTEVIRGKFTPRPRNDPRYYDGEYPFIQTGNITSTGKYIDNYSQTLNEFGLAVSREFPIGTIVMSIAANIADVAILNFRACFPDSVVGFKPNDRIVSDFLFYQLKNLRPEFFKIAIKSTQYNLNVDRVKNIQIFIPPISEQEKIVRKIENDFFKIHHTVSTIEKEITLTQEYKTALIAEAVTGKIDVRGYKIPEILEDENYDEIDEELSMAAEGEAEYETDENHN